MRFGRNLWQHIRMSMFWRKAFPALYDNKLYKDDSGSSTTWAELVSQSFSQTPNELTRPIGICSRLMDFTWLMPCHSLWNTGHRPLAPSSSIFCWCPHLHQALPINSCLHFFQALCSTCFVFLGGRVVFTVALCDHAVTTQSQQCLSQFHLFHLSRSSISAHGQFFSTTLSSPHCPASASACL